MKRILATLSIAALLSACGTPPTVDGGDARPDNIAVDGGGDVATTDTPRSDVPSTDVPTTDTPTDVPSTDVPFMDVPLPDVPSTDVPSTDVPSTDVPSTDVPSTDVPSTDVPSTDVPSTDVPFMDVPLPDVPSPDGGTCSILGVYSISVGGVSLYFRFNADGTWEAAPTIAGLASPTVRGTYTYSAGTLTFSEVGMTTGCSASDVGVYTLRWDATCRTAAMTLVRDSCAPRGMTLSGATLTRESGTVTDAGMPDGGPPDGAVTDGSGPDVPIIGDGGVCLLPGIYRIDLMGLSLYWRFGTDGRWAAAMSVSGLDTSPLNAGTYTHDSATGIVTFGDDMSCMGGSGRYRVTFAPGCRSLTLALISDTCSARSTVLGGLSMSRL